MAWRHKDAAMSDGVDNALRTLLVDALPGLFGGASPAVGLALAGDLLAIDPQSADADAGAPTPDDRIDVFALDPNPDARDALTQPPYRGPRRVRLTTDAGDALALRGEEVAWDALDQRVFQLRLRPAR